MPASADEYKISKIGIFGSIARMAIYEEQPWGQWKTIYNTSDVMILDVAEPKAGRLEIWSYSPVLSDKNGVVDRFSLFLRIKEDNEERVQAALESMMEGIEW